MEILGKLGFEIAGCFLSVLILYNSHTRSHVRSLRRMLFVLMVADTLAASLCSIISTSIEIKGLGSTCFAAEYVFQILFFVTHTALPYLFVLYILENHGALSGHRTSYWIALTALLAVGEFVILLTPLLGQNGIFYYDSTFHYHRGALMPLLYLSAIFYMLVGLEAFIRYRNAATRVSTRVFLFYYLLSLAGVVIQAADSGLMVELFFENLSFLGFLLSNEDENLDRDPQTLLFVRPEFLRRAKSLYAVGKPFMVLQFRVSNMEMYQRLLPEEALGDLEVQLADFAASIRDHYHAFQLSRESYSVIIQNISEENLSGIEQKLTGRFEKPWKVRGTNVLLKAVAAEIMIPEDARDLNTLMDLIEVQYASEDTTAPCVVLKKEELDGVRRDLGTERVLRQALDASVSAGRNAARLEVYYQPIWDSRTQKIIAAETLSRLFDENGRMIPPDQFIPLAEHNGMILNLGLQVFEKSCRYLSEQHLERYGFRYLEINLSTYQLTQADLVENMEAIRQRYQIPVEWLNLEVTETAGLKEEGAVLQPVIDRMRKLGYRFSLDDYGTGSSNMFRLVNNEYANVKVDKSFLWKSEKDEKTRKLLDNLIGIVRSLDLNVTQEGVETKEQLDRIVGVGANLIQGYYFSRPLPGDEFAKFVKEFNTRE